jgi:5'(3')-deoxyribonucleotidase
MKKTLYIDMDNVLVDFESGMAACDPVLLKQYEGHPDEIPGIFGLMQPMPGAVEAFQELASIFDTYIASTAPWSNVQAWTEKRIWVEAHLGERAQKRLILTHHKNLLRGDFIVDEVLIVLRGSTCTLGLSGFRTGKPFWNTSGHKPNG